MYTWIIFNNYKISLKYADAEGWLYAQFYFIFYKGLQICRFDICGGSRINPHGYWETTVVKFLGNQNLYADFQLCVYVSGGGGSVPNLGAVQGSTAFERDTTMRCERKPRN